jgi:hypothetical protein
VSKPILITIPLTPEMRENLTHTRNLTLDVTTVVVAFVEERDAVCTLLAESVEMLRKKCQDCRVSCARLTTDPVCLRCPLDSLLGRADKMLLEVQGDPNDPVSCEEFVVGENAEVHIREIPDENEN